jgi:ankyrin repeat protein
MSMHVKGLIAVAAALLLGGQTAAANDLVDAAKEGDSAAVRSLLDGGTDVDAREVDGSTALHWAVYEDDLDVVQTLIDAGADATIATREGATPMSLASLIGDARMIDLLLNAGADPNERLTHGETPLMMAARTGNVEAIQTLVAHGADVNATEKLRGTTALMWAAANQNAEAIKALIAAGADLSMRSAAIERGRDPYLAPTARSRIESAKRGTGQAGRSIKVDLTGKAGKEANPSVQDLIAEDKPDDKSGAAASGDDSAEASFFRRGPKLKDWGGLTALVFATREGDLDSVEALVDAGADVNQVTEFGWTPLLTATQNRFYDIGKYLLDHGADPNIANKGGWTPLYIATDNRNIEGGDYPVRRARGMDHLDFIKLLLDHDADVNLRMASSTETRTIFTHQWLYEHGATPFLRAAQSGDLTLMKLLLEHGADPSIPTYDKVTPLMVASGIGWVEGVTYEWSPEQTVEVVKLLLDLGADVNAHDIVDHRTALMGAAHKGRPEIVQLLVDHGADLAAHDIGSRDSIHNLAGVTWQAIDYADGLVRVGVQSATAHPDTAALIRKLMEERGLKTPPAGRTLDSICVTPELCQ